MSVHMSLHITFLITYRFTTFAKIVVTYFPHEVFNFIGGNVVTLEQFFHKGFGVHT